jgi:hypothetical protein
MSLPELTEALTLTMEQSFQLKLYEANIHKLNAEQARDLLLTLMKTNYLKQNVINELIKKVI